MENEELQIALEETEGALEMEEAKVLKIQLEFSQLKQTADRKLHEKDEELESSRKNHARQIESLQNTIEVEMRSKSELMKTRKQFESEVFELETQLDAATRNASDGNKMVKKLQAQVKVSFHSYLMCNHSHMIFTV